MSRSCGFQWFFSFFAAFSEYQDSTDPIVVLLDEPGRSLHGEAQEDFVRYVSKELAPSKQTLYTTHSQFMVDPGRYEILRAVHDRATRDNPDQGVEVTLISLSADKDTVLPVESALGYLMSRHLFIGAGQHLRRRGKQRFHLPPAYDRTSAQRWLRRARPTAGRVAVGGADNIPAFVALLGRRLKVSALIDGAKSNRTYERAKSAAEANEVPMLSLVVCRDAQEGLPTEADIEDLFAPPDYLRLYNWTFGKSVTEADLPNNNDRILKRLDSLVGPFDHALPAHTLQSAAPSSSKMSMPIRSSASNNSSCCSTRR